MSREKALQVEMGVCILDGVPVSGADKQFCVAIKLARLTFALRLANRSNGSNESKFSCSCSPRTTSAKVGCDAFHAQLLWEHLSKHQ
jgi:hypothetical protein